MPTSEHIDREESVAWRTWLRDVGNLSRRMRELLGLSQEELGRLVNVSQGAVSRFEKGKGLNTPWIIAVKIRVALAARLRPLDPQLLTDDARRFLSQTDLYGLPPTLSRPPHIEDIALVPTAELETALRAYVRLPEDGRRAFAAIMTAVAEALGGGRVSSGVHPGRRESRNR